MHRIVYNNELTELKKILLIASRINFFNYMYYLPESIEEHNTQLSLLNYGNKYKMFKYYLIEKKDKIELRDVSFFKRHLEIALSHLHKKNIFFYLHFNELCYHKDTSMPLMQNFSRACLLNDVCDKDFQLNIIKKFAKPIQDKCVPFSLFFFHFICFSLHKEDSVALKEVSIYQLYDSNVELFYGWDQDELKEVEKIVRKGGSYEGIFSFYINNKDIWFQWDYVLLERSFRKYM